MRTGSKLAMLLLGVVTLCACHSQDKQDNTRKAVTRTVRGKEMSVGNLEGYGIVCAYKDYLFLKENRDTSRLVVYRIEGDSLKYVKGLIDRGRGPREFYYVEYSLCGDTLFVFNSDPTGMRAIYGIPLDDLSKIDDVRRWKEYSFSEQDIMTGLSFAPYGEGRFIITGGKANTQQIFSLADFKDGRRIPLHFWPRDSTQGALHAKQMVYMQSELCSRGERIVYANLNARYMFIATVEGDSLVEEAVIYSHLPEYEIRQDGNFRFTGEGEYGILLYSTDERVFAQVGRTVREVKESDTYKGYPNWYVDEIEVYDWSGKFVDNYRTDRPFYSYAVSADNRCLYTMSMDLDTKEQIIMRYELQPQETDPGQGPIPEHLSQSILTSQGWPTSRFLKTK